MKKTMSCVALACVCMGMALQTHAATSANLTIQGQITPPACNLSFTDATIDFGTRAFASLNAGGTVLPTQSTTMSIVCDGATRVSFSASDNRPGTAIASSSVTVWPALGSTSYDRAVWGLGTTGSANTKIGALEIGIPASNVTLNGSGMTTGLNVLTASLGSSTWTGGWYTSVRDLIPNRQYSVGTDAIPQRVSNLSVALQLSPVIARRAMLPAADEINLDGSLTFTLHYL